MNRTAIFLTLVFILHFFMVPLTSHTYAATAVGSGSQTNPFPANHSGPIIKVTSSKSGYHNTGGGENTLYDARGTENSVKYPGFVSARTIESANISSGSSGITWYGGFLFYDVPVDLAYQDHYHPPGAGTINHHALMVGNGGDGAQIIAGRLDNVWDGWRPTKSENFVIKGTMATHVHDDVVENDNFAAGLIEDNYWEGYGMYSARSGGSEGIPEEKTVTIRGNIWRIYGFPVDPGKKTPQGTGHLFKVHGGFAPGDGMGKHTKLRIIDNWFLVEDIRYSEFAGHNQDKLLGIPEEMATEISGNHLVWCPPPGAPAKFPGHVPAQGVTVYNGCQYKYLWEEQRDRWLVTHKEVDQRPSVFEGGGGSSGGGTTPTVGVCNLYNSGDIPPTGYGAAWNVLGIRGGVHLRSECQNNNSAKITVGFENYSGSTPLLIYNKGYTYLNGSWKPFTLSGTFAQGSTAWLQGGGTHTLSSLPTGTTYWVGYTCQWINNKWNCGCRDSSCTQAFWQLQGVVR